jgi:hypothetical protein
VLVCTNKEIGLEAGVEGTRYINMFSSPEGQTDVSLIIKSLKLWNCSNIWD